MPVPPCWGLRLGDDLFLGFPGSSSLAPCGDGALLGWPVYLGKPLRGEVGEEAVSVLTGGEVVPFFTRNPLCPAVAAGCMGEALEVAVVGAEALGSVIWGAVSGDEELPI